MPVSQNDPGLNSARNLSIYAKIIGIQTGTLVQQLSHAAVKRMVDIPSDDDEEVTARGDDPLAAILVGALRELASEQGVSQIRPLGAISALFDQGALQRSLRPKLLTAVTLRGGVSMDACRATCTSEQGVNNAKKPVGSSGYKYRTHEYMQDREYFNRCSSLTFRPLPCLGLLARSSAGSRFRGASCRRSADPCLAAWLGAWPSAPVPLGRRQTQAR